MVLGCIRLRNTDPPPGMIVWDILRYTSPSPLAHIDGIWDNVNYISVALRPVTPSYGVILQNSAFPADNARPNVVDIVWTFFGTAVFDLHVLQKFHQ